MLPVCKNVVINVLSCHDIQVLWEWQESASTWRPYGRLENKIIEVSGCGYISGWRCGHIRRTLDALCNVLMSLSSNNGEDWA